MGRMRNKVLGLMAAAFVASLGVGALTCNEMIAANADEAPVFAMVEGAQVRTANPAGIRFVTDVNDAYKAALAESYPTTEYTWVWGTVLTFTDAAGTAQTIDAKTKQWIENDTRWYTALVDIPATDYLTEITAESYVKVYAVNDTETVVYSDTVSNAQTRSIAYSASWALNDGYDQEILYTYTKAIPDTSVELDKESESVVAGTEIQLNANAQPAGYGVAWRSSDTSVATVDKNGKVTAINAGEAIITATLGNATDSYQLTVTPSAESQLVTEFYMKGTDANVYHQADFAHVKGVVSEDNFAYGKYDLGDGRTNATTMYATLSYEYMKTLFAANIVEIKFDVILSVADKKLQINARDLPEGVSYTTSSAEVNGKTYYVYTVTMERAYYETLSKDITLRYTFGKDANNNTIGNVQSEFFFIDNLQVVEGEIKLYENKLVTSFNKDSGNASASRQTLTTNNTANGATDIFGISSISSNNSATMYFRLSKSYMTEMFADESVTAIAFDVILSTGTAKIQGPGNANEVMQEGATSSNGSYYIYSITVTRARYEQLTTDYMRLRYTGGGNSTFFYVDNLALVR